MDNPRNVTGPFPHLSFKEVPDLGIGAEHGFYVRRPKGTRWEAMIPSFDRTWMHLARNVMDVYSSRTHGTYIEQKESALIWQYREADPEFGQMQSKELEDHLAGVLRGYPVEAPVFPVQYPGGRGR